MKELQGVVSDLDHTLLRGDQNVSPEDLAAIAALRTRNIPVVLATGRHHIMCGPVVDQVGSHVPIITNNGATIFNPAAGEVLHTITMPREIVAEIWQACLVQGRMCHVFTPHRVLVSGDFRSPGFPDRVVGDIALKVPSIPFERQAEDFNPAGMEVVKLGVPNLPSQELGEFLRLVPSAEKLSATYSGKDFIDITMREATKGTAVAWLAPRLGFKPENALIMGDNGNDVSMLKLAGWPVAPQNAMPETKAASSFITSDNEHSPLANALSALFPEIFSKNP